MATHFFLALVIVKCIEDENIPPRSMLVLSHRPTEDSLIHGLDQCVPKLHTIWLISHSWGFRSSHQQLYLLGQASVYSFYYPLGFAFLSRSVCHETLCQLLTTYNHTILKDDRYGSALAYQYSSPFSLAVHIVTWVVKGSKNANRLLHWVEAPYICHCHSAYFHILWVIA